MKRRDLCIAHLRHLITNQSGYLVSYDPEAYDGRGDVVLTPFEDKAMRATAEQFLALRNIAPQCHPVRETDGRPNRPLTAYDMEITKA